MPATPILTNRSLMLAKIETTYNVDSLPVPATNAFLVMNADIKLNPNVLRRNFYRPSLSPLPIFVGRKLASVTFTHEVKGSGLAATAPKLGTLLRGCGFAQTSIAVTAAAEIANPIASSINTSPVITWAKTAAPTKGWSRYKLKVGLGGASATAKFIVFGNPPDWAETAIFPDDEFSATVMGPGATTTFVVDYTTDPLVPTYTIGTPQVGDIVVASVGGTRFKYVIGSTTPATEATAIALLIDADTRCSAAAVAAVISVTLTGGVTGAITSGTTAINLGGSGAQITPTWTGTLILNDTWVVDLKRPGYWYAPISTGFESLTIYMYYDGLLHRITGCIGTVVITAQAGQYATAQFTFTGQYHNPDDQTLPTTPVFEATNPTQVELAQLKIGNAKDICAQSYSLDMAIQVNPRDCVSNTDGYNGVLYTSREPKGGANPEMALESEEPYWRNMAAATLLQFHGGVGTVQYNRVEIISNSVQLTGVTYADRNNLRVYDLGLQFVEDQFTGDDEIFLAFT